MISNNKAVIVIVLIIVLVAGFFVKTNWFILGFSKGDSVKLTNNTIEVTTTSKSINIYQIEGNTPLVERKVNNKVIQSYSAGDSDRFSSTKERNEILYVGVPNNFNFVEISSVSGSISGALKARDIELSTVSGSIRIENLEGEDIELDTVSGSIDVNSLTASNFDCQGVSGSIDVDNYNCPEGSFNSVSGSILIKSSLPSFDYSFTSVSSTKELEILQDENSSNNLDINSVSGSIRVKKL
jgi:hypothetical protein